MSSDVDLLKKKHEKTKLTGQKRYLSSDVVKPKYKQRAYTDTVPERN